MTQDKKSETSKRPCLLVMDWEDIDRALVGPGAWEEGRVSKDSPRPPTMKELLKRLPAMFRR